MMLLSLLMALSLSMIMLLIYWLVSYSPAYSSSKLTSFECGYSPLSLPRRPFSVRYFILVVLFLVFDVETVLLFPLLTSMTTLESVATGLMLTMFLLILLVGLLYEWYNSMLEWVM
uniref:NADH-ubiquinone oxidoreductase chain 3 n=1 Tax=Cernuella virgata TaxID=145650 RepID=A0A1B0TKT5_9EUPU|nr:NADH dehydrogenase subunit 3 [Cernuella virgata]